MRGTLPGAGICPLRRGLIPTYAGNTPQPLAASPNARAHPHVCGEHLQGNFGSTYRKGSSPRMRGTLWDGVVWAIQNGLIPTYAGNTHRPQPVDGPCGAHPHVCGEHMASFSTGYTKMGSSPRMRGTHLLTWGFIPTHQVLELVWSPKPVLTLHDFWAYRRREARLYLLALLHPFRGPSSSFGADGRIISFTPSKSTGSHG